MNTLYWLVKREIWEHKGGFIRAPLIGGAIFLVLNLMALIAGEVVSGQNIRFGGNSIRELGKLLDEKQLAMVGMGLDTAMLFSTAIISVVMGFVVFFYCLGALYDDRRDRSLLFWKSLPISDTQTVLSKVLAATIVAPAVAFVTGVVAGLITLLMYAAVLSMHGLGVWQLLTLAHPFRVIANLIASIPMYFLWALPTVGWLLLCSAWAKSKPFLWAVAIPVVTGVMIWWVQLMGLLPESNFYWSHFLPRLLGSVWPGSWFAAAHHASNNVSLGMGLDGVENPDNPMVQFLSLGNLYATLGTTTAWIGMICGVALIAGAIWIRRWRDDT